MLAKERLMTAEELIKLPPHQRRGELIKGEFIKMSPAGHIHGEYAGNIFALLWNFVKQHKLGKVYAAETGFLLSRDPDTIRAPDAAFVKATRLSDQTQIGFFAGAPDLAVEVVSPSETVEEIETKIIDYLEAGTQQVWLIYPRTKSVTIYRSLTDIEAFSVVDTLDGGDLLPGFSLKVQEIFE